jgi:sugar-specific transcriptional regulator TrmB
MLLNLKEAKASTLAEKMALQRAEIYRVLDELQLKGLIEKRISMPTIFSAIPIDIGFRMLMRAKKNNLLQLERVGEEFLNYRKKNALEKRSSNPNKYNINIVKGKQRILDIVSTLNASTFKNIKILACLPHWFPIAYSCFESYKAALSRGVSIKMVIAEKKFRLTEELRLLLIEPNFKIYISPTPLKTNGTVFDQEKACISLMPGSSSVAAPLIYTNHISMGSMLDDHFENTLSLSHEYKLSKK